jgi:D-methionine transport system substrate-binding protein
MGVYSASIPSLADIPDGASIGVPNDTDNYARAIDFLNALGLLENAPTDPEAISEING